MSPVSIGLDLLLVALLPTALYVGLRLNGRLNALRNGQAGFIKAVGELDAAAARAESGLLALRAASENTHDELLTRIETARGLIARLDAASEKAGRLVEAAAIPAVQPAPTPFAPSAAVARPESRTAPRFRPVASRPAARGLDDDLFEAEAAESPISALKRRLGERL
jgi:hypothetical protein